MRRHETHTSGRVIDLDPRSRGERERSVVFCESGLIARHADCAGEGAEILGEGRVVLAGIEDELGESLDREWWMSVSKSSARHFEKAEKECADG